MTKIEGNYVEGLVNYTYNGRIGSYPVFGHFNFTHLYLYNNNPSAEWPTIKEYRIDQNGRILYRTRTASKIGGGSPLGNTVMNRQALNGFMALTNNSNTNPSGKTDLGLVLCEDEPKYDVDLFPYDRKYNEEYSSTGFISKTDDYLGAYTKSTPSSEGTQTLTEKLKELKKLYDDELITKDEYNKARKALLEK